VSVSTDLLAELDGWDVVSESLEAFRAGHEESGRFLAELLDRVDSLLLELLREQERWRAEHQRAQSELSQKAMLLHHQEQQIACEWAQIEQARAEGRATEPDAEQQQRLEAMLEQVQQDWAALCESLPETEAHGKLLAGVTGQMTEARVELADLRAEMQRLIEPIELVAQEALPQRASEWLQAEMSAVREERDAMRQERLLLESELENVRRRSEQSAEALEEQKRAAAEQESHWREEFRRQRSLLEELAGRLAATGPACSVAPAEGVDNPSAIPPAVAAQDGRPRRAAKGGTGGGDSALESVRAQFELLQEEASRRRKENADST